MQRHFPSIPLHTVSHSMAILVIEDDPKTGDYLRKGLRESGYAVDLDRKSVV